MQELRKTYMEVDPDTEIVWRRIVESEEGWGGARATNWTKSYELNREITILPFWFLQKLGPAGEGIVAVS